MGAPNAPVPERLARRLDKSAGPDGCWVWTGGTNKSGYGRINTDGTIELAHRVAFRLATGEDIAGLLVCHRCDNPPCCNPAHLFLGTNADNVHDMHAKGRAVVGSAHYAAKLTEDDVRSILRMRSAGMLQREVGAVFGVAGITISDIERGRTWRRVTEVAS